MRRRRRHWREEERARRPYWREDPRARRRFGVIGCLWLIFVVVVVILVLGFIFGGWRQGTKINQPGTVPLRVVAVAVAGPVPVPAQAAEQF